MPSQHKVIDRTCDQCGTAFTSQLRNPARPGSLTGRFCSALCRGRNHPKYLKNSAIIETVEFHLSLGFTPEQVLADFIVDTHRIDSWVRMLERRDLLKLAAIFRPLTDANGRNGGRGGFTEDANAVDAA